MGRFQAARPKISQPFLHASPHLPTLLEANAATVRAVVLPWIDTAYVADVRVGAD